MNASEKLANWYATLSPATLAQIGQYYAPNAHFKDPFNEVHDVAGIEKIFQHMFATTERPRFVFLDTIEQGQQAFLTWQFHFGLKGKQYTVQGGSHLVFDATGKVTEHRDYWDAAEELWQKLPVIGGLVRLLRRQFVVT